MFDDESILKQEQRDEAEEKATEVLHQAKLKEIRLEKRLLASILAKMGSMACGAGGAPRDWQRGDTCNDIDIFYESTAVCTTDAMAELKRMLTLNLCDHGVTERQELIGWGFKSTMDLEMNPIYNTTPLIDIRATEQYGNSNIKGVYECNITMREHFYEDSDEEARQYSTQDEASGILTKKVQFIHVRDASAHGLFKHFDCSMNCTAVSLQEFGTMSNNFLVSYNSTLYEVGLATNIVVFTEETWNNGIELNKLFQRFCNKTTKEPQMRVGNQTDMLVSLMNDNYIADSGKRISNDSSERRHLKYADDLPF